MRTAETILGIVRDRGKRELPLERVYRLLYNPELYLRAYARLYSNQGTMTQGATTETIDGMSVVKIDQIIHDLRHERFRWTPVRWVYIPKKNGKRRPLGLPTWTDKLLQEVMRSILEAYFEPQFSKHSHGFRPEHGCHTALNAIMDGWTGTKWFIEGDVTGCFDNIDHKVLMEIISRKIHDNRLLKLLQYLLEAGYLEDWKHNKTLSGAPQGGIISPLLSNIYLNELDKFVEQELYPTYNRGKRRLPHPEYRRLIQQSQRLKQRGRLEEAKARYQAARQLPTQDPDDPNYRRLRYVRYADDWLLGFAGPKKEAKEIKVKLQRFLQEHLKLDLSEEKTLITHAKNGAARFLGYEICNMHANNKFDHRGRRSVNGHIMLRVPWDVIVSLRSRYERHSKPHSRADLLEDDDFTIVSRYGAELRGYVNYYSLAHNVGKLSR